MPTGVGGHVLTGPTGEAMFDRIVVAPILDAGGPGQAWVSYLLTVETTPLDGDNWRSIDMFSGAGWGAYITGTGQPYGTATFGFFDVDSDVPITVGQVYWIVVKIEFSGDGNDDDVYLWVDPDPGDEPSTASAIVSTTTSNADNGLRRVAIVSMGPGRWDRIRLATTWIDCFGFSPKLASSPVPIDGAINVDPTLALLEWDAPIEVTGPLYDVYFGTYGEDDPNFTVTNAQLEDNTANTSTDPTPVGDLVMDTQYYWRVDVNDPNGGFPPEGVLREGTIWTFTTWPYEPIILTQPENTSTTPGGTAQFTVESGGNLAGSHYFTWYKQVGPDPNHTFDTEVKAETLESTGISTLTITNAQYNDNPVLNDEGLYYCKVRNIPGAHPDTAYSDSAGLMLMRLMARYPFNGSYTDEASQYDATKVGGGGIGTGIEGWGAFHLTGSNNYVYVPFIIAEAVGAFEGFTIAAWVKPDPGEKEAVIWAGYDDTAEETAGGLSGGEGFSIERQADGTVFVRVEGNDPETISVAGAIPEDQWTHVVFVYDSNDKVGTGTVYLNGEQAGQVEYDIGRAQQIGSFSMGAYRPDGAKPRWFLDGWLDDVRFYAYPITAVNVASLYNEITGGSACTGNPEADLNDSCTVELVDYAEILSNWLASNIVVP